MAKVLLVEDSEMARFALSALLRFNGHKVTEANDGKEASGYLATETFDIVVTDIFMPELDGVELIQHLRSNYPALKIIAISGGGARQLPSYALRLATVLGVDSSLQKPVESTLFLKEVERLTSGNQEG